MKKKEKIILFLGSADTDAVTAKLKATNTNYKRKMLDSSLKNWDSIFEYFDNYHVTLVIVKLTTHIFNLMCSKTYSEYTKRLLKMTSLVPNLFLVHESILTGERSKDYDPNLDVYDQEIDIYHDAFAPPEKNIRDEVLKLLDNNKITLTPYKKNAEMSIICTSHIEHNEQNLIFRIYIPNERMWANEAEKLLQLFSDYLHKVSGLDVRQDQFRTSQGIVYEFFGTDDIDSSTLPAKFDEFSEFMDSCVSNQNNAQALLESKNLSNREVITLIEKYSKEARRLHIDLKHERERKLLNIRHSLESELGEFARTTSDWENINMIVDKSVPNAISVGSAITLNNTLPLSSYNNVTININPQTIETVNGVVAQEITGNQHFGTDAKKLLEIIKEYGEENKIELSSAVHEISDKSIKETERIAAKSKLKGFVYKVADKIGDVSAGILQKYIESQLGM